MAWEIKKLGELLKLEYGKPLPKDKINPNGKYPVYGANGEKYRSDEYYYDKPSIIVGRKGSAGEINLTEKKFWALDVTYFVTFDTKKQDLYFIYYLLSTLKLPSLAKGVKPGINRNEVYSIRVQIPPLPEQKHIVAILDKAFEKISKAKENAEKNFNNAKEIFEGYLQSVFKNKSKGWEEKRIKELSTKKNAIVSGPFGSNLKVEHYQDEGIPIIRLQNIGKGYFINKDIKYISEKKAEELKYHSFVSGDIVLAKLGLPIGKTCKIPDYLEKGIIVADVVRIRPDKGIVNYDFLEYYLNTNLSVSQLTKNVSGATRPRVNLSDVRNIVINLPDIDTQKKLLVQLNSFSKETKKLEATYDQKLADLEELKQSILQKAFKGELTEASA
jgi:type I restriction enzyme S subunit